MAGSRKSARLAEKFLSGPYLKHVFDDLERDEVLPEDLVVVLNTNDRFRLTTYKTIEDRDAAIKTAFQKGKELYEPKGFYFLGTVQEFREYVALHVIRAPHVNPLHAQRMIRLILDYYVDKVCLMCVKTDLCGEVQLARQLCDKCVVLA